MSGRSRRNHRVDLLRSIQRRKGQQRNLHETQMPYFGIVEFERKSEFLNSQTIGLYRKSLLANGQRKRRATMATEDQQRLEDHNRLEATEKP